MSTRYFEKQGYGVYGYDSNQTDLIQSAIDNGWLEVTGKWPPAPTLAEIKANKLSELKQHRNQAKLEPVTVGGRSYAADEDTQAMFSKLANRLRAGKPIKVTEILDIADDPVPVTLNRLENIEDKYSDQIENADEKFTKLAKQVKAATTPEAVDLINW